MRSRLPRLAGAASAVIAAAAMVATSPVMPVVAAGGPVHAVHAVRPVPAITGYQLHQTLSFPPTTAQCEQLLSLACYSPLQYRQAYDIKPLYAQGITGRRRTIAVVDSFGSPTIRNDLHVFDQTYGLPDPPSLNIIAPAGAIPPFDPTNADMLGWATETTLDVEYAHAIAPDANILLVETPVAETEGVTGFPEIVTAENYVINHHLADVISQSFGATEQTFPSAQSLLALRSAFKNAAEHNVTVLASSGDTGATNYENDLATLYPFRVNSWPSSDPLVTSLGGTQLHLDADGNRTAPDQVWNDGFGAGGGGLSVIFRRPNFQNSVRTVVGDQRGTPDISMSSAVDGAAIIYYTFRPGSEGYHLVGGTSEAAPIFAGVVALADQYAHTRLGDLNPALYQLARHGGRGIVDVTIGNNTFGGVTGFPATPGYDLASGWGTVDVARFVPAIARTAEGER
jgi:subtilase family serine protease